MEIVEKCLLVVIKAQGAGRLSVLQSLQELLVKRKYLLILLLLLLTDASQL